MLNHARCLLMNVAGGSAPAAGLPGEELVDPAYVPVEVPPLLAALRTALFGAAPDRHMLNYRTRQLLAAAHASPLAAYVTALDRRVTYDLSRPAYADPAAWLPAVTSSGGTLTVAGVPDPPDAAGVVAHAYLVTTAGGDVRVERLTRPAGAVVSPAAAGVKVPLPGCGASFRLATADPGQRHRVDVYARPALGPSGLVAAASRLGEPVYNFLFGVARVEPWATFRALWFRSPELPPRLAALACALAYRTEEVRLGR